MDLDADLRRLRDRVTKLEGMTTTPAGLSVPADLHARVDTMEGLMKAMLEDVGARLGALEGLVKDDQIRIVELETRVQGQPTGAPPNPDPAG